MSLHTAIGVVMTIALMIAAYFGYTVLPRRNRRRRDGEVGPAINKKAGDQHGGWPPGRIRVGVIGSLLTGLILALLFGLGSYYWRFPLPRSLPLGIAIGLVWGALGALVAYRRGLSFPRRWK
jgi:hypothetical protein